MSESSPIEPPNPQNDSHDQMLHPDSFCDIHVVGIGASAGGLEALESFFNHMPLDSGMAFVVVQHLSPDFKSHMEQLLARQTKMPIHRVEDQMPVEPNSIYLIPPKKEMIISEHKLLLTDKGPERSLTHPIDQFFRSLANDVGRFAVGIILSGTGSDGSRGIRDIHDAGGLVIVQSEESARFDGMPLNAQETGIVDLICPPEDMPAALTRYVKDALSPQMLSEEDLLSGQGKELEQVFQLLRQDHRLDFSVYKSTTIGRRIQRRATILQCANLEDYLARLKEDQQERDDLYRDLLIGVTRFFRDEPAFERLEKEIIPEILSRTEPTDTVRVWSAGCGTGEEAYSIAMLFHEAFTQMHKPIRLKMFATDVHRTSLEFAAAGRYSKESLEGVSKKRIEKFFREDRDGFQVLPELRQLVVFAPQNVIGDAPFTQMDLIICRNMLIYLQPIAQKKALSLFHFSLKTGGILFLGPSETPGEIADEFQVIDKRWKLYRKRRDVRLPPETRLSFSGSATSLPRESLSTGDSRRKSIDKQTIVTYDRLLEQFMPPSFLVDESFQLLHTFGGAETFLKLRAGRPSTHLLDLVDEELKTSLSGALQHALKENTIVRYSGIYVQQGENKQHLQLTVQPILDPHSRVVQLLVKLEELDTPEESLIQGEEVNLDELSRDHIRSLESELHSTRENLQATIEELETANEELQAANEELVASNEELQSTNEELHSVNEELYTVNAEHQRKIEELTLSNDDMDNLLATTKVGVIFVDDDFRIRRFTPEIARVFHLMPQDVGRRIDSFAHNLEYGGLLQDVEKCLNYKEMVEREVIDRQKNPYLLRIQPYQTADSIQGVVLTLIDVKSLVEMRANLAQFKFIVDHAIDTHALIDAEGHFLYVNEAMCRSMGYTEDELLSMTAMDIEPTMDKAGFRSLFQEMHRESIPLFESVFQRKDGSTFPVEITLSLLEMEGKDCIYATSRDITERKQAERRLATEHAITQTLVDRNSLSSALEEILTAFTENLHIEIAEFWNVEKETLTLELQRTKNLIESAQWRQTSQTMRFRRGEGLPGKIWQEREPIWIANVLDNDVFGRPEAAKLSKLQSGFGFPILARGSCIGVVCLFSQEQLPKDAPLLRMLRSIGLELGQFAQRTQAEHELQLRNRAIASATDSIIITDAKAEDNPIIYVNDAFFRSTGYTAQEVLGKNCRFLQGKDTNPKAVQRIREAIQHERQCDEILLNYKKDGTPFWNQLTISPVKDEKGTVTHFVGVQHDITERKKFEERLRITQKEAQAANRAKSQFLAHMSHEIRSPMTAILGYADVLLAEVTQPKFVAHLNTIKRNGQHLLEIINDILDLSRIEAGKIEIEKQPTSLPHLLSDVESLMQVRATEKKLALSFEFAGAVPETIHVDKTRLRQVLVNLIANAIKFTEEGSVTIRTEYQTATPPSICIQVIDTGIGISEEQQAKLFRPFSQADRSISEKYGGSGLGLSISKRLTELMGGVILVESQEGQGSTFSINFPIEPVDESKCVIPEIKNKALPTHEPLSPSPVLTNARILLAEDSPDLLELTALLLEKAGATVISAKNGQLALEKIQEAEATGKPFDLFVLDMEMPELSGYELAKQLREKNITQPIFALTASAMKGTREKCLNAGCTEYFPKPVDRRTFLASIEKHLNQSQTYQQSQTGRKVLLVDDNTDTAHATGTLLGVEGHMLEYAKNGREAIELWKSFRPDVVLMDINLPDMDGYTVLSRIREQGDYSKTLFIALSGNSEPEDIRRSQESGFHHYVVKPADTEELNSLIVAMNRLE